MFMNNQCLFTVCSRGREHEQFREQLVNIGLNPAGSGSPPRRRGQGLPRFLSSVGVPDGGEGGEHALANGLGRLVVAVLDALLKGV